MKEHLSEGIFWNTEDNTIYFDIKQNSIGLNRRIVLKRDSKGILEMRVEKLNQFIENSIIKS